MNWMPRASNFWHVWFPDAGLMLNICISPSAVWIQECTTGRLTWELTVMRRFFTSKWFCLCHSVEWYRRQFGVNMKLTTFCRGSQGLMDCNTNSYGRQRVPLHRAAFSQALPSQCRREAYSGAKSRRGGGSEGSSNMSQRTASHCMSPYVGCMEQRVMFLRLEPAFAEASLQAIRWLGSEELKEAWNNFFEIFIKLYIFYSCFRNMSFGPLSGNAFVAIPLGPCLSGPKGVGLSGHSKFENFCAFRRWTERVTCHFGLLGFVLSQLLSFSGSLPVQICCLCIAA